jgi:hypothetical protein
MVGVSDDALHRTDRDTLRGIEVPYAFGTPVGIDDIDLFTLRNRPVRAFRFTHIAVDAFIGNQ